MKEFSKDLYMEKLCKYYSVLSVFVLRTWPKNHWVSMWPKLLWNWQKLDSKVKTCSTHSNNNPTMHHCATTAFSQLRLRELEMLKVNLKSILANRFPLGWKLYQLLLAILVSYCSKLMIHNTYRTIIYKRAILYKIVAYQNPSHILRYVARRTYPTIRFMIQSIHF